MAAESLSDDYNGKTIVNEEIIREEEKKKLISQYQRMFIEEPHFLIKFEKMNISFDPRNIVPLEDKGNVYLNIRVTDLWGILTVTKGALLSARWDSITVTNPITTTGKTITGDGWTLELNAGYTIVREEDSTNYKLIRQ